MTDSGRASSLRRGKRSTSQMIVAALVALAVVASLFLIFSESVTLLRVGVVVALWAAMMGAIAMTKYRRESAADQAKVRDLQTVYELQLEREITARREYEMGVEAKVRSEVNLDVSEIAALRAELAALRGSLEVLFEGRLPVDRAALQADATRIPELASAPRPPAEGPRPKADYPRARTFTPDPAYAATPSAGPTFATPFDEPVTAEVLVVAESEPEPTPAAASPIPRPVPPPRSVPQPTAPVSVPPIPVPEQVPPTPAPVPLPEPEPVPAPDPAPVQTAQPTSTAEVLSRRSRRRAAESEPEPAVEAQTADPAGAHSTGLSVAEILANMKTTESGADGKGGPTSGRRRGD